jgi:hypothetical protein
MLPDYIAKAAPNPKSKRGPWYANTMVREYRSQLCGNIFVDRLLPLHG